MQRHIILSFSITIILLILLAYISIYKMLELSNLSQKLYEHPFVVTNATKEIQSNIISIQKDMQDILTSNSNDELKNSIENIKAKVIIVNNQFEKIFKKYLGNKSDIENSFQAFKKWEPIRDEIISLIKKKNYESAININKTLAKEHIKNLNTQVNILIEFAHNKAVLFFNDIQKSKSEAIFFIISTVLLILLIIVSMFWFLIVNLNEKDKERKKYLQMIDQNIFSGKLDENLDFIKISDALLQILGYSSKDFTSISNRIYADNKSFDKEKVLNILNSGNTWEGEIKVQISHKKTKCFISKIVPIFDNNYNITGYNNIFKDITSEKRIEEISRHDSMTNIYNRRYFDEIFPKQINISSRNNLLLVFAMIDIDKFKDYNDTYGHQEGDNTLIKVAKVLSQTMKRSSDYAFRIGGEEFGLLFNTKDEKDALKIVENIKQKVENLKIEHSKNKASKYVTISIGVKIINPDCKATVEELYASADKALYEAKETGRNKIVFLDK